MVAGRKLGDEFRKAGLLRGSTSSNNRCFSCGKSVSEGHFFCRACQKDPRIPAEYLVDGYFGSDGNIREELLQRLPKSIAKMLGTKKLKNHQLRAFFHHVRAAENKMHLGLAFEQVRGDIKNLEVFAADRVARGTESVPKQFYDFIVRNVESIKTGKDFLKGFVPHFQAVVAYFRYFFPRS